MVVKGIYELPCYWHNGKKTIGLTLNWYRNAHFQILAKAKREYNPVTVVQCYGKYNDVAIRYTINFPTKRRTDFMNWLSVADKFFLDWLVKHEIIEDDSIFQYAFMDARCTFDKYKEQKIIAELY